MLKILILTKFGRLGASSRMRTHQFLVRPELNFIQLVVSPLINDDMLRVRYKTGRYGLLTLLKAYCNRFNMLAKCREFDFIWIEKEALPWLPLWLEKLLLSSTPYVLDYDDAVFHSYDLHPNKLVRFFFGCRLDRLMEGSKLVICGNSYLASRARDANAIQVEILPTVVDLDRYILRARVPSSKNVPIIVWIGSPSTIRYLDDLNEVFKILAKQFSFKLRVIGGFIEIPGVEVECLPWTEVSEVTLLQEADIGIMPLSDSAWERGKCGYKLIQYMACSLPVVASGVGVNREIVSNKKNGFIADTLVDWVNNLSMLLESPSLRVRMGEVGREFVEVKYSLQSAAPRLANLLKNVGGVPNKTITIKH